MYAVIKTYEGNREIEKVFTDEDSFDEAVEYAEKKTAQDLEKYGYNKGIYRVVELGGNDEI